MKRSAIILFLVVLLGACGKKTEPKPPHAVRPKPPSKVNVKLHFWGAEISFKIPKRKVDGNPLDGLKGFRILRHGESLTGPKKIYEEEIFVSLSKEMFENLSWYHFNDRGLRPGMRYYYEIRAVRGWRSVSDPARSPSFAWYTPPAAPKNLTAKGWDGYVFLNWLPVTSFLDGRAAPSHLFRYRIYRFEPPKLRKPLPVLVPEHSFFDYDVRNGRLYCYQVAAVLDYYGSLIEGPLSNKACARPEDLTPPAAPQGLTAIPFRGGVLLRWRRNGEPDLLGYKVYRKRPGETPVLLTPQPIKEPKYFDRPPGPGFYYYFVTAVDDSPRHNESPPSEMSSVEIPGTKEED